MLLPPAAEGNALDVLREVDEVFVNSIREWGLYNDIWQAFAVFLPVRSVGEPPGGGGGGEPARERPPCARLHSVL